MIGYFDFETGGLKPGEHEPVEMAMILLDEELNEIDRFETGLMNVQRPECLHPKALEVNGYTKEEIAKGRDPMFAFMEFFGWLNGMAGTSKIRLGGHNVDFDIRFLKQAMKDYLPHLSFDNFFEIDVVDTKTIAKLVLPGIPVYEGNKSQNSLTNLTAHFGIEHLAHKAMGDVEAGVQVLRELGVMTSA